MVSAPFRRPNSESGAPAIGTDEDTMEISLWSPWGQALTWFKRSRQNFGNDLAGFGLRICSGFDGQLATSRQNKLWNSD